MDFAQIFTTPDTYVSLLVLTAVEIVLGIDNIVFITILSGRLPKDRQAGARRLGVAVALVSRLALLAAISWVMRLDAHVLFTIRAFEFTAKDLVLVAGGLFLLWKATHEIYENVERPHEHQPHAIQASGEPATDPERIRKLYVSIILQVLALDMVFSIDSVITAVGLVDHVVIMAIAMVLAVIVMFVFAGPIGEFIQRHASIRVLALAFLVLIGFLLITEGFGVHVNKGFVYFAMGFSLVVEMLNHRMRSRKARLESRLGS